MGAALSFLGQKLFASSTLISARCENVSCCTSVAAVQPPIVRRTGGFLKKRMTTIYVDSRESPCTCRATPGWLSTRSESRTAFCLLGRRRAWHAELGAPSGRRGLPAGRLDQLQLRYCDAKRNHEQPERSLRRQPAHSERSGAAAAVPSRCGRPHLTGRLAIQALQHRPHARPELRFWRAAGL